MYHASEVLTQKWHALKHLWDALTHVGGIDSLHTGMEEASHEQFMAKYALRSREKRPVVDEVVKMQNNNDPEAFNTFLNHNCLKSWTVESDREVRKTDSTVFAWSEPKSTLLALDSVMFEVENSYGGRFDRNYDDNTARGPLE